VLKIQGGKKGGKKGELQQEINKNNNSNCSKVFKVMSVAIVEFWLNDFQIPSGGTL